MSIEICKMSIYKNALEKIYQRGYNVEYKQFGGQYMDNFIFHNYTKIIFGKDTEKTVGSEIKKYGSRVLLHYGGGSVKKNGVYDKVTSSLKEAGVEFIELGGVQPNPVVSLVREGVKLCKDNKIEAILAVGGGSVIDSAKAIALGALYDGDVWDFHARKAVPERSLPLGTVLTIPAAGSESSDCSVITNEDGLIKRGLHGECMYPEFSIINPELMYSLPKNQIANGCSDIFAHLAERYFTNTKGVEFTDRMIEAAMKTVVNNAKKIYDGAADYDTWAQVVWAGTIAHNNLLNTGRVGDWGSHNIEHELSAHYGIAHGAGLAIVFPAWMKHVVSHDIPRFVQFATRIFNIENDVFDPIGTAAKGITAYEDFLKSLGLPLRLSEAGIGSEKFGIMAKQAIEIGGGKQGHFVELSEKDITEILQLAE